MEYSWSFRMDIMHVKSFLDPYLLTRCLVPKPHQPLETPIISSPHPTPLNMIHGRGRAHSESAPRTTREAPPKHPMPSEDIQLPDLQSADLRSFMPRTAGENSTSIHDTSSGDTLSSFPYLHFSRHDPCQFLPFGALVLLVTYHVFFSQRAEFRVEPRGVIGKIGGREVRGRREGTSRRRRSTM